MQMNLGVWTVIGAGIGVAIGAATHNLGLWLGIGVALGVAIGASMRGRPGKSH
jgi:hypothetical protein